MRTLVTTFCAESPAGREVRVIDMANLVNELTGNPAGLRYIPRRKWDHKSRLLASIEKARRLIGHAPQTDFRLGLEHTVCWFRDHWPKSSPRRGSDW